MMRSLTSFSTSATCCGVSGAIEIEGQLVRPDERTFLRSFPVHDLMQRPMQQMRDGVMALNRVAAALVHN